MEMISYLVCDGCTIYGYIVFYGLIFLLLFLFIKLLIDWLEDKDLWKVKKNGR